MVICLTINFVIKFYFIVDICIFPDYMCTFSCVGEIIWRRVLEKGENGLVKLLIHYGNELVTVSGSNVAVVRFWDTALGFINNQYSVTLPADIKWVFLHN